MKVYLLSYDLPYWDGGSSVLGIYSSLKAARKAAQSDSKKKLVWTAFYRGVTTAADVDPLTDYSITRMDVK